MMEAASRSRIRISGGMMTDRITVRSRAAGTREMETETGRIIMIRTARRDLWEGFPIRRFRRQIR